jgi:hypothetical protein
MQQPTAYPHVNALLSTLLMQMQHILGEKLVGLYLYGSLVTGDYDDVSSDVDLLAAIASDLTEDDFNALKKMHDAIVADNSRWDNRFEIAYLSVNALKTFKTQNSQIGIISPGEPFHLIEAGKDWLMNWYIVREQGMTLFGASPQDVIAPISKAEFIQCTSDHAAGWREWVNDSESRPAQAYAILTLCRAFYSYKNGEQTSKLKAALWTANELPQWAALITNALAWRRAWDEDVVDHGATLPETKRFVHFIIDQIVS